MKHDLAKAITAAYAPDLVVDDAVSDSQLHIVVRRFAGGPQHSIFIGDLDPAMYPPIPAVPAVEAVPAVPATDDHPGTPEIPAQPARPARTTEGLIAHVEQAALKQAIDSARNQLSD